MMASGYVRDVEPSIDSPELKTIKDCTPQLETALSGCDRNLVHFLEEKGFVSSQVHDEVLDWRLMLTEVQRAGELVRGIRKRVSKHSASFHVLVCQLKQCGTSYEPIVNILEERYKAVSTTQSSDGQTEHQVADTDRQSSQVQYEDSESDFDLSSLSPDALEDLRFKLRMDMKEITNHYGSYVDYIRTSIIKQGVSAKELSSVLMGYSAFSLSEQEELRISQNKEIAKAADVNDIFIELHREYSSFLNYEIFQILQKRYVLDNGQEELTYPERLKTYIESLKIAEFIEVKPAKKNTKISRELILKLDIRATAKLSGVRDLKYKLAKILRLHPMKLQLHDLSKGCVLVTFLIMNTAVDSIFTGNKNDIFTSEQIEQFQALKILWLKCNNYEWHFSSEVSEMSTHKFVNVPNVMVAKEDKGPEEEEARMLFIKYINWRFQQHRERSVEGVIQAQDMPDSAQKVAIALFTLGDSIDHVAAAPDKAEAKGFISTLFEKVIRTPGITFSILSRYIKDLLQRDSWGTDPDWM